MRHHILTELLRLAAVGQLLIAVLNLGLERIMGWTADVERLPLLIREVHRVHVWFISTTLFIFFAVTVRFAPEFASGVNPICRWLAVGICGFWIFRTVLQVAYYSPAHWRGRAGRTCIHVTLLLVYGFFGLVYLMTAF